MNKAGWLIRPVIIGLCFLTAALYAIMGCTVFSELKNIRAEDADYNLLVKGFRSGQLSLKKEVPLELVQLPDPYDPYVNDALREGNFGSTALQDLSYYRGHLYLYFGVTPALILFWPYVAVTGHYLNHQQAVTIFSAAGFILGTGLIYAGWRRYFQEVGFMIVAAGALALGWANGIPFLLQRPDLWEVPISFAYAMVMLTLVMIWQAMHAPAGRNRWLMLAGTAYGLAVGARPSLLFGSVILLVPILQAWASSAAPGRRRWPEALGQLAAAMTPLLLIGLGLLFYNYLRFGDVAEFGQHYQLAGDRQDRIHHFGLVHLWFNFRVYFLTPVGLSHIFPYVAAIRPPPLPAGHGALDYPFGILVDLPFTCLAVAAPLAWRGRPEGQRSILRWFIAAIVAFFGTSALTLCLFYGTCARYEVEFIPALALLAVLGLFGLERSLAGSVWPRRVMRCAWVALLVVSVAFNLLFGFKRRADQARFSEPDLTEAHESAGNLLLRIPGRLREAITHYEMALRFNPNVMEIHSNLAFAFLLLPGHLSDAIFHYEESLRISPNYAKTHTRLANVLVQLPGRQAEAIAHYERALQLKPDYLEAHDNLGRVLLNTPGRLSDAIAQFKAVLALEPDLPEAHYNFGVALLRLPDRESEAEGHLREALRLRPDFAPARQALDVLESDRRRRAGGNRN